MILQNVSVLTADVFNGNGRLYPLSTLKQVLNEHRDQKISGRIEMPELNTHLDNLLYLNLADIAFESTLKEIKEGQLLVDIKVLDTLKGKWFKEQLESGAIVNPQFRTAGHIKIGKCALDLSKVEVIHLLLCQINYVSNPA